MGKRTIVPFGPQHPALPEPVHLDLELEDETVVRAIPSIGYVHRGLEKLVEKRDYQQMTYIMERVCGICSFGHGYGYVGAVEGLMGVEIPDRARMLRIVFHELSRVHSHLLWMGLLADGMGFDSLFMRCWRIRERVLDVFEAITGGRVIVSFCRIGGVSTDVTDEQIRMIRSAVDRIEKEVEATAPVFLRDASVRSRLKGVGAISREDMIDLCGVGPTARGSGVCNDVRRLDPLYGELGFSPVLRDDGDCLARCEVRIEELLQSLRIIREALGRLPAGEWRTPVKGNPPVGEYAFRVEQPRGEAFYYVKGNGTKFLERARVRTPTNINIAAMTRMLQGCSLQDVSMIIITIDPCISCTERRWHGIHEDGCEAPLESGEKARNKKLSCHSTRIPSRQPRTSRVRSVGLHTVQHLRQEVPCGRHTGGQEGPHGDDTADAVRPMRILRRILSEKLPVDRSGLYAAGFNQGYRRLHRPRKGEADERNGREGSACLKPSNDLI